MKWVNQDPFGQFFSTSPPASPFVLLGILRGHPCPSYISVYGPAVHEVIQSLTGLDVPYSCLAGKEVGAQAGVAMPAWNSLYPLLQLKPTVLQALCSFTAQEAKPEATFPTQAPADSC